MRHVRQSDRSMVVGVTPMSMTVVRGMVVVRMVGSGNHGYLSVAKGSGSFGYCPIINI
jgi:hypothetical protein